MSRHRHLPSWFTGWYMGRVAGRYCPCEWPIKSRKLIDLCAWIDDEAERHDLIRFAAFHMQIYHQPMVYTTTGTTSGTNAVSTRIRFFRTRHNGSQVER